MSCLSEKLIPFKPSPSVVTKVMGSLVTLGCCALKEPGLEFGVISEGSSKKQSHLPLHLASHS